MEYAALVDSLLDDEDNVESEFPGAAIATALVWQGAAWHGMAWHGMAWHGRL